jgi:hypothetical protein
MIDHLFFFLCAENLRNDGFPRNLCGGRAVCQAETKVDFGFFTDYKYELW